MTLRPIPNEFSAAGMNLVLMDRTPTAALYRSYTVYGDLAGYEVHKLRFTKASVGKVGGKTFVREARERLAGSSEFGVWAWMFPPQSLAQASARLKAL